MQTSNSSYDLGETSLYHTPIFETSYSFNQNTFFYCSNFDGKCQLIAICDFKMQHKVLVDNITFKIQLHKTVTNKNISRGLDVFPAR